MTQDDEKDPLIFGQQTEADFVDHIAQTDAAWTFISDQLNIHQSEGLVRWVASQCQLEGPLGEKGTTGILHK